jgi:hypothetical protein
MALGELGPEARDAVLEEMRRLAEEARASLGSTSLSLVSIEHPPVDGAEREGELTEANAPPRRVERRAQFSQDRTWSEYERAIFDAIGAIANTEVGLAIVRPLVEATDAFVERARATGGVPRVFPYHELYGYPWGGPSMPASLVMGRARAIASAALGLSADDILNLAEHPTELSSGMLFLVCLFFARGFWNATPERKEHLASLAPALLKRAWRGGFYHLKFEALEIVPAVARSATERDLGRLREAVEEFDTKSNLFLNSVWFEAALALGMIEPPHSAQDVGDQLTAILSSTLVPEAYKFAYATYADQLDPVVGSAAFDAIERLGPADRLRLCSMALLGAEPGSFATGMCLHELIEHADIAREPLAVEAIERWSACPPKDSRFLPSEAVAAFALATVGRSALGLEPRRAVGPVGTSEAVWLACGEILYWAVTPNLDVHARRDRCRQAWTYLIENVADAAGPICWLDRAARHGRAFGRELGSQLFAAWSTEIARLCENAVGRLDELRPTFSFPDSDVALFVVEQVARLPPARARMLLEPLADRADVGNAVILALKHGGTAA